MSTAITSNTTNLSGITNSLSSKNSGAVQNPNSILGKDSFLKLLLTELQYQDPTSPMDTGKILDQTSQLATLESADNTNKTMENLVSRLNSSMNMGALAAIGKIASLGSNAISLPKDGLAKFEVYFKDKIQSGTLSISDSKGNVVRTVSLDKQAGKAGVLSFQWDGVSDNGEKMKQGLYSVTADYTDANGNALKTQFGIYPVESVRYDNGKPLMKLGSSYVPMSNIHEFY
ncbi:MAG: flagellar hook capping protein [Epsilonproteobacteria bacterium]|nr:flagellar hook capping protein [Campylobacterota bacterium]